jgi:hypothetical protein
MSRVNRVERLFRRAGSNDASEDHRTTDGTAGGVARRSRLLADVAVRTTVTGHLSEALAGMRRSRSRHAPGRILVHLAWRSATARQRSPTSPCSPMRLTSVGAVARTRRAGGSSANSTLSSSAWWRMPERQRGRRSVRSAPDQQACVPISRGRRPRAARPVVVESTGRHCCDHNGQST